MLMPTNQPIIRDPRYLKWLRTQPCVITSHTATEDESVVAAHIGTAGKGIKSSDDETLPVLHSFHAEAHAHGEITTFRKLAPDWLLRAALRAYAREMYQKWLKEGSPK